MQDFDVDETIQKNRKNKYEIKKYLQESIINGSTNRNIEVEDKVNIVKTREDAAKVVQEFEQGNNIKSGIAWFTYYQAEIFQKFKEKRRFLSMASKVSVGKLTIVFKVNLLKLINKSPQIKHFS